MRSQVTSPMRLSGYWRLLPWVGLSVVAVGVLAGYLGFIPGVWGQTALLAIFLASVLAQRHDLASATVLVGLAIVEDWFQLIPIPHDAFYVSIIGAMALLLVLFVGDRGARPWRQVRPLDLAFWGLFLLLGLLAVPRGRDLPGNPRTTLFIALNYWIYVFLAAFVFWLLGMMIARRGLDVRRLCILLAGLASLLALHAIVQEVTGVVLFETPYWAHYLAQPVVNDYRLAGGPARATTFFMAPDITESFFGSVVFLPLGLLLTSRGWGERILYVAETILILLALLFTFGPVGWAAVAVGVVVFAVVSLRGRARLILLGGLAVLALVGGVLLSRELRLLLKHATGKSELALRTGIWRTALNVIHAHPLLGIGLGQGPVYELRAAAYQDSSLTHMYSNTQNSFLEFAAFAGLPVLLVFLIVLGRGLIGAVRNYQLADTQVRPLILGGLLVVIGFCITGLSDITFTAAPLVPLIYLLLGALSSPRLARSFQAAEANVGDKQVAQPIAAPVRYGPPQSTATAPHASGGSE